MSDIIQLLPDSVANQIAAGEVIQRPASVVKELTENSIDAGATSISVVIKDAGKTLIQVTDNGKGMSETDARMAFERHATSKITKATDLFSIHTMGFRGEALASVAAVADVQLKTRRASDDIGTLIHIKGSEIITQEPVQTAAGTTFLIKNLFFNIPARRKFLKADPTEYRHIKTEFIKTALANENIEFQLIHNGNTDYKLPASNLRMRIINIFGKSLNTQLVPVKSDTSILKINGYIGKPETAKKRNQEQFFFVNRRYMRHGYFYKAVVSAYEGLIANGMNPSFFLYFDIDPSRIDINIHPQKTEINFDDTQGIYSLLRASIREALGKHNVVPSIDFDQDGAIDLFAPSSKNDDSDFINTPDAFYNPFEQANRTNSQSRNYTKTTGDNYSDNLNNWEKLYDGFEKEKTQQSDRQDTQTEITHNDIQSYSSVMQFAGKYIVTPVKSGLMLINYKRAKERILFEKLMLLSEQKEVASQSLLYPKEVPLNQSDYEILLSVKKELAQLGFIIETKNEDTILITALPSELSEVNPKAILEDLIILLRDEPDAVSEKVTELICEISVRKLSANMTQKLNQEDMLLIIHNLFATQFPNHTNDGRTIISIIEHHELERRFM